MSELKQQYQRPEGKLIEQALRRVPKKSMRKLADEVQLSEARVRQIINGYQSHGDGQTTAVVGPADTVARIAQAAGVTADEMRRVDRADVADEMNPLRGVGVTEEGDLWLSDHERETQALVDWLGLPENERGGPPTLALALWETGQLLEAALERHKDEMRLKNYVISALSDRPSLKDADEMRRRIAELETQVPDAGPNLSAVAFTGEVEPDDFPEG